MGWIYWRRRRDDVSSYHSFSSSDKMRVVIERDLDEEIGLLTTGIYYENADGSANALVGDMTRAKLMRHPLARD